MNQLDSRLIENIVLCSVCVRSYNIFRCSVLSVFALRAKFSVLFGLVFALRAKNGVLFCSCSYRTRTNTNVRNIRVRVLSSLTVACKNEENWKLKV